MKISCYRRLCFILLPLLLSFAGRAYGAVELNIWSYSNQKIPDAVIAEFVKANPGVTVNQKLHTGSSFRDQGFLVAAAAGVPPDVIHLNADFLPMYVMNNLVQPLTTWIDRGVFGNLNVYFPGVLDSLKYKGEYYFLPHRMSNNTLIYNRQMFAENGIDPNKPPVTWDDFYAVAKRLTIRGNGSTATRYGAELSVSSSTLTSWFQPTLWQAGGDILAQTGTSAAAASEASRVAFNTNEGREALRWYTDKVQEGIAASSSGKFWLGQAGMLWQSYSTPVKQYRDRGNDWLDVGPALSYRNKAGYGSLAGWVVAKGGSHIELAVQFLAFTLHRENVQQFLSETYFLPVRKDIGINYFAVNDQRWAQKFIDEVPYTRFDILHPEIRTLQPMIAQVLSQAVSGQMTVGGALEEAERQANQYLKEKGY